MSILCDHYYYCYYYQNLKQKPKLEKQNCLEIAFATPQAPESRNTETNQVSSHAATVDNTLNPSNVPV